MAVSARIPLSRGYVAMVDAADFSLLSTSDWCAHCTKHSIYPVRKVQTSRGKRLLFMSRYLLGLDFDDPRIANHRDGNSLNNRRENLRIATKHENTWTIRRRPPSKSGFIGVIWNKWKKRWQARIRRDGKLRHIGWFPTKEAAAEAYDQAAIAQRGDFAITNESLSRIG
jgi:hypothetical protein